MTAQAAAGELFHSFSKYLSSSSQMPGLVRELLEGFEKVTWWQEGPGACLQEAPSLQESETGISTVIGTPTSSSLDPPPPELQV